ncbi:MAG: universal stress protein [Actinomycetota bacterium]
MYKHIVVGTDGSATAKIATDRAAGLAGALSAKLTLVHGGHDSDGSLASLAEEYEAGFVAEAGSPADVLISKTEELGADLLVVGSVGMRGAKRFRLGNVPNKVSHHAVSDLLVVKTDPPSASRAGAVYDKILAGTDGSPTAMSAVDRAADLARELDARLTIVCAYEPPTEAELKKMRGTSSGDIDALWNADRELRDVPEEFRWRIAGAAQAEDVLERSAEHSSKHGIDAATRAEKGPAAEVLIGLAEREGFDLIVVGNVGMSGAKRLMLGNVPHRVSHHSPTDVLILRTS